MICEETDRQALLDIGFIGGVASPCCFKHPGRQIANVVHGSDVTALGRADDLNWYEAQLAKVFGLKSRGRMGENTDCKVMRIRNRIVALSDEGLTYEGDPCRAEPLVRNLGLANGHGAVTPGIKESDFTMRAAKGTGSFDAVR